MARRSQRIPGMPQTSSGLDALGFATYNNNPQAGVKVLQGRYTVTVGNPNIAPGSSSTPQMLSTVGRGASIPVYQHLGESNQSTKSASAPYRPSNGYPVGRAPSPCYSTGSTIQGQKPMPSPGTGPSFEKLAPKPMSTKPGPMGTDYKN